MVVRFRFGTDLASVGEQVWTGALLLADYLIAHHAALFGRQPSATVLELGAGTGLCNGQQQVLRNCEYNMRCNRLSETKDGGVFVRHLDWQHPPAWLREHDRQRASVPASEEAASMFEWRAADIARVTSDVQIFVAADVIYDNDATSAFLGIVHELLRPSPLFQCSERILYMASEKRINFSLEELRATAVAHDHFFRELRHYPHLQVETDLLPVDRTLPRRFPYTRNDNLVLWRVRWREDGAMFDKPDG
ncbi:hypothetical protein SYNPS1DRAFT_22183 [Syncephalis pseudoplumigaleata]|uniref:Methyltransferase-domain-containing protein n=1 Tax=Syncephalis pseudoplumigaleata TaxID=1712513 RepID=A0A4P9Z2E7_9FUNG|nr:hypothetical protein SYNPS1DRAFT_22183 [Syncephalis pseudoplumigaleata]|eukprot:RKP25951.1 hypothetical protein SYNPS1DRAFT_22183 [Syncephalis pseudoplumigaleata]